MDTTGARTTSDGDGSVGGVLIADRGRAFAEALAKLLDAAGVRAVASGYDDALEACRLLRPAVMLLDGDPPLTDASGVADAARSARSDVRIILLLARPHGRVRAVADIGADGWVSRHSSPDDLLAAVRGGPTRSPSTRHARHSARRVHSSEGLDRLTPREVQILRAVAAGGQSAAIAAALGISPHTVRTHVHNIFAKLGVSSRMHAASVAHDAGLRALSVQELQQLQARDTA